MFIHARTLARPHACTPARLNTPRLNRNLSTLNFYLAHARTPARCKVIKRVYCMLKCRSISYFLKTLYTFFLSECASYCGWNGASCYEDENDIGCECQNGNFGPDCDKGKCKAVFTQTKKLRKETQNPIFLKATFVYKHSNSSPLFTQKQIIFFFA